MDCSRTIDFFAELKRLCDSRLTCEAVAHDEQCPLYGFCGLTHSKLYAEEAKKAIEKMQKWSDEHPKKTYAQDFFEKFPNALREGNNTPKACRKNIYGGNICGEYSRCAECWSEPI